MANETLSENRSRTQVIYKSFGERVVEKDSLLRLRRIKRNKIKTVIE